MTYRKLKVSKNLFYGVSTITVLSILLLGFQVLPHKFIAPMNSIRSDSKKNEAPVLVAGTAEKMEYLSSINSSFCGLQPKSVDGYADSDRIQGACCGAMELHRYQEQVRGLKEFSDLSQIPSDPYDISAKLAKELFAYQKDIQLTDAQQTVYAEATKVSHEGGPCCCKCWRWTAFEGQAKYLITKHNFDAEQIAKVWDVEDGCGGTGHTHT